jgi:chemotaxis methyl-accepting protein methylase
VKPLFIPTLSPQQTGKNLSRLIVFGSIRNPALERDIVRLRKRFQAYSAFYPFGLWDAGLAVTNEMRAETELYLPMEEISRAFNRLFSLALRYPPETGHTILTASTSWIDALRRLHQVSPVVNPGRLLESLASDERYRIRFLCALLLPNHHGGSFRRYPAQLRFLEKWIQGRENTRNRKLRCLDAACGTGEGVYDLAVLLRACGVSVKERLIHGCSLEPLEPFAAAHGYFPHDPEKENLFHRMIGPLFASGETRGIVFFRDDVLRPPPLNEEPYDIVLCNGLLGGPFIHGKERLAAAVTSLARRMGPGGILLAADRFHGGWKKEAPPEELKGMLQRNGFRLLPIEDGIAAERVWK